MSNADLGGGSSGLQDGVSDLEMIVGPDGGVTTKLGSAKGLSNVGLLVKTWGRVMSVKTGASPSFVISDGYQMAVKVWAPSGFALPAVGDVVVVTGISTISLNPDGTKDRAVRLRSAGDMTLP
jgi:hypothetical protein